MAACALELACPNLADHPPAKPVAAELATGWLHRVDLWSLFRRMFCQNTRNTESVKFLSEMNDSDEMCYMFSTAHLDAKVRIVDMSLDI